MQLTQVICDRCKGTIDYSRWEEGWPCYGRIELGFAAQIFAVLGGANIASKEHFEWWEEGHGAMTQNNAQNVIFDWNHKTNYRLCYNCQKELIKTVGAFFKIPERVEEIKGGSQIQEFKPNKEIML